MAQTTLEQAYLAASTTNARSVIIPLITAHPEVAKAIPTGRDSTILHQLVASNNVAVFREIIKIPGVWFPLDFTDGSGRTFMEVLEHSPDSPAKRSMVTFLNFLAEWDQICELAKYYIEAENEKVWAWLRRNAQYCYSAPPSRKWSIAMQVVYFGNIEFLEFMLNICPRCRGMPPIWEIRGNDGMSLLDVASMDEVQYSNPNMLVYVLARSQGREYIPIDATIPLVQNSTSSGQPQPEAPLGQSHAIWDSIREAQIERAEGVCPLSGVAGKLYTCSRDCNHAFNANSLSQYLQRTLEERAFPFRCPICKGENSERGLMTRGSIKALVTKRVIDRETGGLILDQQIQSVTDEASLDLQFSMSKPCPYCTTPIAHYKGHGCHHIRPGGGCPSCAHHFCYTCLSSYGDGTVWQGCPNNDELFCDENCDCPECPDCTPGNPCDACDGPDDACPKCKVR